MMAAIEEAEHGAQSGRAREWLLPRRPRPARTPLWIADGAASRAWSPVSPVTGQLDASRGRPRRTPSAPPAKPMDPEEDEPHRS